LAREAERDALESLVRENWPDEFGPLALPNVPFVSPAGSRWAELYLLTHHRDRVSLGSQEYLTRSWGSVQITLYCPSGLGSRMNRLASDYLESYFEDRLIVLGSEEKVQFGTPVSRETTGVQERQEGTNDNWLRTVVDCPFQRDQVVRK
jgi:hypothetical protein